MENKRYSRDMEMLLIQIARKQKELFLAGFDLNRHEPIPIRKPKRRLFGRRSPTAYEILCSELTALQRQAINRLPYTSDACWWQISWENVKAVMELVLYEPRRDQDWRFESTLELFPGEDGVQYVILSEEGASQTYTEENICQYEQISDYSEEERKEIMAQYDNAVRKHNLAQAFEFEYRGACAKSPLSAKIYKDFVEYYVSEGWWVDSGCRTNYEQNLYKDKYVEGVSASVTLKARAKGVFAVGCYKTDSSGCLTGFKSFDYHPIHIFPENLKEVLLARRVAGASIYKLCEFMNTDKNIRKIPFSLINSFTGNAEARTKDDGLYLLCIQSILFTLLSDKLIPSLS